MNFYFYDKTQTCGRVLWRLFSITKIFKEHIKRYGYKRNFFNIFYSTPKSLLKKNNSRFKIQITVKRKRRAYFKNKLYLVDSPTFWEKTTYTPWRIRKIKFRHNLKTVLRNRRLLRHFFTITKIKSYYLTKIITKINHKNLSNRVDLISSCIGSILLRCHIMYSLIDSYWYFLHGFIRLNSKPCLDFFSKLVKGDVISLDYYIFRCSFLKYYKHRYFRWLRYRLRRIRWLVRGYTYYNKKLNDNNILNRWMLAKKMFKCVNSDFHCEYKSSLVVYLGLNNIVRFKKSRNFFSFISSNMFMFNNWYYNH